MTSGQSTESSVGRDSTTASRLSPEPPKRPAAPVAGALSTGGETSNPGGRSPSGTEVPSVGCSGERSPRWLHPAGRAPEHQARSSRCRLAGHAHLFSAGPTMPHATAHEERPNRTEAQTAWRRQTMHGSVSIPSEEGTRPRTHVGIPGPDVCGADADTPTSTALAPCGVRASRFVSVGTNSNGSPTATDVAVSPASWRHEDATCGPRCSVAAARAEPVQRRTLAGTLPWPGCAPLPVCSHPEVGAPGGVKSRYLSRGQTWKDEPSPHPSPRGWRMRLGGTSPWRATYHVPAHEGRHGLSG